MDLSDGIAAVLPTVEGRVLQVLARTDMPLSGSRIASFIPTASREGVRLALHRLIRSGLVLTQSAPPALMHTGNRRHLLWPAIEQLVLAADQVVYALKRRIVDQVDAAFPREGARISLALFGSVARGESGPDSDVDVLLITPDDLDAELVDALVVAIVDDVGLATGNECNVYAISRTRFDELAANNDPIIASWVTDAVGFSGPDLHRRLKGAPWDEQ